MVNFDEVDFFTDLNLIRSPHGFFEHLRAKGPVAPLPTHGVIGITGYDEGFEVYRNHDTFSSIVTATGPIPPLPFVPDPIDISAQLDQHRAHMPYGAMLVAQDPPDHTRSRMLLMGLLTPKRFRENEEYLFGLADRLIDRFIDKGGIEVIADYSHPFASLAIADLLGMPEEDSADVLAVIGAGLPGQIGEAPQATNPLATLAMKFYGYMEERRRAPRDDVMTILAQAKYQNGELPDIAEIVSLAALLFGAGQDTTVRLIAAMLKTLGENPALQQQVRDDRTLIPEFVEEVLRLDGPTKAVFRVARRQAKVGDVDVAPGTIIMLAQAAMNRDPRKFEEPNNFQFGRKNLREHVAFGRGVHACIGAPLARAEATLTLDRLLNRIRNIRINEAEHGPLGARSYDYEPNYTQRSLRSLHIEFDKI